MIAIKKFEKEHPGVKVHYETGIRKEDYSEWLDRKILEGETPDVFMVLSDDFYKYVSLNVISDQIIRLLMIGILKRSIFLIQYQILEIS